MCFPSWTLSISKHTVLARGSKQARYFAITVTDSEFLRQSLSGFSYIFPHEVSPCSVGKGNPQLISSSANHQAYEKLPMYYYYYTAFLQNHQLWQIFNSKHSCWHVLEDTFLNRCSGASQAFRYFCLEVCNTLGKGRSATHATVTTWAQNTQSIVSHRRRSFRNTLGLLSQHYLDA